MNRIYLFLACLFLIGFIACKHDSNGSTTSLSTEASEQTDPDQIGDSLIFFSCNKIVQEGDQNQHFEVFLNIASNKAKVGETESCDKIPAANYADYNIAEDAVAAIGNSELVLYVIRTGPGKVVVRQGLGDGNGGYNYRAVASFTESEMSANPDMNQAELVGTYAGQMANSNMSYLLFVGLSGKILTAQLFRFEGEIPTQDKIIEAMKTAEPELLRNFVVNMTDMTFESSTGNGKFIRTDNDGMNVQFDAILTPNKEPLVLERMRLSAQ